MNKYGTTHGGDEKKGKKKDWNGMKMSALMNKCNAKNSGENENTTHEMEWNGIQWKRTAETDGTDRDAGCEGHDSSKKRCILLKILYQRTNRHSPTVMLEIDLRESPFLLLYHVSIVGSYISIPLYKL